MLLFRMGPRHLFLRSENVPELADFLVEHLDGKVTDLETGMARATDYSTLCFLTGINHEKTYIEDAKEIVFVNDGSSAILSAIVNSHAYDLLNKVDMGPTTIIMRVPGNLQVVKDRINSIFDGREVNLIQGIGLGEKNDTIIFFTDKVLSGPVSEFLGPKILIPFPARQVQDRLRLEGLRFVTQSLEDRQWYELRINIYDSSGRYEENYDRLMHIFSKLEVGMILGESWTKDYALMLYSVLTYQIRLFTFYKPIDIKKILMALEYTLDGNRLVDFDLYYKNKKIYWTDIKKRRDRRTKAEEVRELRLDLYEKLSLKDIQILEDMEKPLIK